MNLNKLLKPESIAIVGASQGNGMGGMLVRNLLASKCQKRLYFINPKYDELHGKKCYHSFADLPEVPDMAMICIRKDFVEDTLRQAAAFGTKTAVVCSSGYSEVGTAEGKAAEESLTALCKELDMTMMGANCAGFVNGIDNILALSIASLNPRTEKGSVGMVSQSGQVAINMHETPNLNFSYAISSGNSTAIEYEDYVQFLVDDQDTKVISLYLEGIKNPSKFIQALKSAALKQKPVIILKTGSSEKGGKVAASHTGSLAGSDVAYDAVFKRYGVIRVLDMEELIQASLLFSTLKKMPHNSNFASVNFSGGETAMCADVGEKYGIHFPEFDENTSSILQKALPYYATISNPLDSTATLTTDIASYNATMKAIEDDDNIGMILMGMNLPAIPIYGTKNPLSYIFDNQVKVCRESSKPIGYIQFYNSGVDEGLMKALREAGTPVLETPIYAFRLLKKLGEYVDFINDSNKQLEIALPDAANDGKTMSLSEHESKVLLKTYGIPVPEEFVAKNEAELMEAAKVLGYPIVLKIESNEILHKSDVGGVVLNVNSDQALVEGYRKVLANVKTHCPEASYNGVLVQKMMPKGEEFIVGVNSDLQFGPMIMCGLGGVSVELFKDISLRPVPVNEKVAREMIDELKGAKLLKGYRGSALADLDALVDLIVNVSDMVEKQGDIDELDLNPVFVYPQGQGVGIADALIVRK